MTTKANMALAELAEKGADSDLLREMIQYVAPRMMDMACGVTPGHSSRSSRSRMTHRGRQLQFAEIPRRPKAASRQGQLSGRQLPR
jgi:hypothetical protein